MMADNGNSGFSHRHWCEVYGHYYECGEDCVCICGLPMNGSDSGGVRSLLILRAFA